MEKKVIAACAYPTPGGQPIKSVQMKKDGTPFGVGEDVPIPVQKLEQLKLVSTYRSPSNHSSVRLSIAAYLLDKLLVTNQVTVYSSKDTVYVEIDKIPFLVKGGLVRSRATDKNDVYALLAYEAALIETNKLQELTNSFKQCASQYSHNGFVPVTYAGLFCDSFYYGATRNIAGDQDTPGCFNRDDTLILEEVEAAIRSGELKPSKLFSVYGQPSPRCVMVEDKSLKTTVETPKEDDTKELYERCKAGEFRLNHDWGEDGMKRIRPLSFLEKYVPCDTFFKVLRKINLRLSRIKDRMENGATGAEAIGNDDIEMTICGKPGTGKTQLIYAISAACGLPVYMSNASHDTDEDEYEGKTKIVNGTPQAVPTEALLGFENGGIVLIEEANLPQAAVMMGALGQAIEYPYTIKKNGYETVQRHPLCIFASTMNVGTAGSKAVSEPFANRFKASYVMDDPDKKQFIEILQKASGQPQYTCKNVYNAYEKIVTALKSDTYGAANTESILLSLSMRSCIGALQNIEEGSSPREAIIDSIIGKIAERDLAVAKSCTGILDGITGLDV